MSDSSAVLSGEFASRYQIERVIGRGATAVVYLARDVQRGESVALKVLKPELAASLGADRFLREIRLHQRLLHPRILPVIDSGNADGHLYFALPYAEGGTLRDRLVREKQLQLRDVIRMAQAVAEALSYSHAKGLVHRDVKPENILFTHGQPCLGDFGIAQALEQALETSTSSGLVRGTPAYMSPEQAAGQTELDGRSDLFSLGCVLFEAIAGVPPFVAATPQAVIALRLSRTPDSVSVFRTTVPTTLDRIVAKCLEMAPADRFQTASELTAPLDAALADVDNPLARRGVDDGARRRKIRSLWIAGAAAAAALTALFAWPNPPGESVAGAGVIPPGDPRRIAVLYLDVLTPETVPAHIADGITEDLIDRLGGVRALHVISPNGVRQYRGTSVAVDSIGRALHVGTIVGGSLARSGNIIRANVRLVDAASGRQLQSETLEERWTELFALQDRLTERVAFVLRQQVGDAVALLENRRSTNSRAAWELAQQASAEVRLATITGQRNDPQSPLLFLRGDSLYGQAQRLDPQWTLPQVRRGRIALALAVSSPVPPELADSSAYRHLAPRDRTQIWIRRALSIADSAVTRTPQSVEALTLRADARYRQLTMQATGTDSLAALVEADLRRAVDVRPDAPAWASLAQLWTFQGRFAEAANAARRAFEADAFFEVRRTVSTALTASLYAEQYDEAREWCRLGLSHYAGDPRFSQCALTILGWSGKRPSDVDSAWRLLGDIERRDTLSLLSASWSYRRIMIAAMLARSGLRDSALRVLDLARSRSAAQPTGRTDAIGEAYVRLLLGDRTGALSDLEAYVNASPGARPQLKTHPWFRPLAAERRFQALLQPAP